MSKLLRPAIEIGILTLFFSILKGVIVSIVDSESFYIDLGIILESLVIALIVELVFLDARKNGTKD
ncbi:hypothetical protein ACIGGE_17290 [Qipengyuania sp. NPDC077410]|uniref:hypothetical protein n=1 Tax=Qipengyuania sp. NPDC077410 TaxID=3364496 RepID=UPI0037C9DBA5